MPLTEEQKQAILEEASANAHLRVMDRPKGTGKTKRPKNFLRKRKTAKKQTQASKRRNRK